MSVYSEKHSWKQYHSLAFLNLEILVTTPSVAHKPRHVDHLVLSSSCACSGPCHLDQKWLPPAQAARSCPTLRCNVTACSLDNRRRIFISEPLVHGMLCLLTASLSGPSAPTFDLLPNRLPAVILGYLATAFLHDARGFWRNIFQRCPQSPQCQRRTSRPNVCQNNN